MKNNIEMDIKTNDNQIIITDGVQTIAGNAGTFGYTYNSPADSITITKDGKSVTTGALSTSTVNGEALTPTNIDEKMKPIFLTLSGGSGGGATINVVDNLTSISATDALSANQGKVLKDLIDSLPSGGGVERKIINVTDTKLRLDPNYDLLYVWDFGNNVPFTSFIMTEDTATASLNTTNQATIVLVNRSTVASTIIVTLPKNLVWNNDPDAKYYINVAKPSAGNTPTPDTQTTFSMGRNEMKVINIYGLGDKRVMELDY